MQMKHCDIRGMDYKQTKLNLAAHALLLQEGPNWVESQTAFVKCLV